MGEMFHICMMCRRSGSVQKNSDQWLAGPFAHPAWVCDSGTSRCCGQYSCADRNISNTVIPEQLYFEH